MANKAIPNPLERRHLIERSSTPEQALQLAELYLAEGRSWDAIAFLAKAGARERMAALREEVVAQGDSFLARELTRAIGDELPAPTWRRVAEAAAAAGKERYAAQALALAERGEGRT